MRFIRPGLFHLTLLMAALVWTAALPSRVAADTFQDMFTGMTLNPVWTVNTPQAGPTVSVKNGLTIAVPGTATYDYWSTVGNAPNVSLPAPAGDFTFSAQLQPVVDTTGAPVESLNYHAALFVNFGGTDDFFWGAYKSNATLMLERSGTNNIANVAITGTPVWLQVQKVGNAYHFSYRENATDPWTELTDANGNPAVQTVAKTPVSIGMMVKTWSNVEADVTFNSFTLTGSAVHFPGTLSGKVTTNGPSPSKVTVQATNAINGTVTTAAVAADGTYSTSLPPGPYAVTAIGDALAGPVTAANVTVPSSQTANANFTVQLLPDLNPATDQVFDDKFTGTTLNPAWHQVIPLAGPTISANNGLKFTLPDTSAYDYWVGVSNSPQLHLPAPAGDFTEAVKINSVTDNTGAALPAPTNFHTALQVYFGGTDSLFFGAYQSDTHLQVERSGQGNLAGADITGLPEWVQITKTGNDYTFAYKQNDTDSWTPVNGADGKPFVLHINQTAQAVGLVQKTWTATNLVSTFSEYRLEAVKLRQYGTLSGKVTATGNSPAGVTIQVTDAQGNVVATAPVAADGTYSAVVGEGTYTVSATGSEVIPGQAGATQAGVAIAAGGTATANFTVNLLGPLNAMTDQVFTDDFSGTTLKPQWLAAIPSPGPTIMANNGLVFHLPGTSAFDYWTGVGNAPALELPAPLGDFTESGTLKSVVDPTGAQIAGMNFHAVVMVNFGGTDTIFWGAYQSDTHLQLERSGTGNIAGADIGGLPVSLQITNTGGDYSFQYRSKDTDPWTDLTDANGNKEIIHVATPPQLVGIMQKQWAAFESTTTWTNYRLEAPQLQSFATISGAVKVPAGDMSTLQVQILNAGGQIVDTIPVAAAGTYSATLLSGTYTVRVVDDSPSIRATNAGVALAGNQTTTVNFDLTQPTGGGVLGDLNGDGKVDIKDATLSLQIAVGSLMPTAAQTTAGDVNHDGKLNIQDTTLILGAAVGIRTLQ